MPSPSECTYRWWERRRGGAFPNNSRHVGAEGAAFQSDVAIGLSPPFRWEDLTVPSLFGVGLQTWPFAQEAATRLAESLSAELFTIAGAGHTAHVSHPRQFAEFVRRSTALATDAATAG